MTHCYVCGGVCNGQYWVKRRVGKVEVLAMVCKVCLKAEVSL